jgi:hypothetical protein
MLGIDGAGVSISRVFSSSQTAADARRIIEAWRQAYNTAVGYSASATWRPTSSGCRPLAAHCHLGLGKLFHRSGDRAKAAEHLAIAATMYRKMDMGFWLE